jgi:hypothetical protein
MVVSEKTGGLIFKSATEVMEFAKLMAISNTGVREHLRGNPGACLAICVQALEWGMSSYAVASKSYSVNNQIAFEAQLIEAVILRRAPIKGRPKTEYSGEGDNRTLRVWAELRDEPGEIVEYISPKFGKINPKNSPLWKNDPDQQLHYFSVRAWCRRHFPDVLLGVYEREEIEHSPRIGPDRARDVTPPKTTAAKLDALAKPREEAKAEPARAEPEFDEETGDVESDSEEPFPGDETPRDRLIADLRSKIIAGAGVMGLLGTMSKEDRVLLTDADVAGLRDAEARMGKKGGAK